ncbi:MAG: GAF domain-containing protein [Anaerolineales bacterium]|nr:GAF domain-containing protein [Anaerolineales bacterium]
MVQEPINFELLLKMVDISQRMAETRELKPLLDYALDEAIKLVGAERGYLILLNPDHTLDFRAKRDKDGAQLTDPADQISHSVLNKVINSGRPIILRNTAEHPDFKLSTSVIRLRLRSIMAVPLISRGVTLGALYVENRSREGQFTQNALSPLTLFANQAAVAIENAILNESLEAKVAARTAELEQAMAELEHRWTEAVEFNRVWSLLSSTIAHDIRAPLSVIFTALDQLNERTFGELTPDQDMVISTAQRSVRHALNLTNDFFDLIKLEMKKLAIYPEVADTRLYLLSLYEIGRAMPWSKGVHFELSLEPDLPALKFDSTRMQQVIVNLLSNALKFTQQGKVILYARTSRDKAEVIVGVRDTGPGIDPTELETIFERFRQAGTADMRRRGTGLGLAICKELVELHQGKIWVESQLNVGSDFKFALPVPGS